jgi:hypothetical protein
MQFRKKPVVVDAFKYGKHPAPDWFKEMIADGKAKPHVSPHSDNPFFAYCHIVTLEGTMRADSGDWIIQGIKGEVYPCKPDIFEATYEAVQATPAQEPEQGQGAT